jgi:hypothetical protein
VGEAVGELGGAAFEFSEDAFDSVAIPVCFVLESYVVAVAGRLQPQRCKKLGSTAGLYR